MKINGSVSGALPRVAVCALVAAMLPAEFGSAQAPLQTPPASPSPVETPAAPEISVVDLLSDEELAALAAPIALYPDVLLAQVLTAATCPIDVVQAARWLRSQPDMATLMEQPWDPSVLSLCNYPDLIYMLDEDLDWTNALGAAFLHQQQALMDAVQELRRSAQSSGVLQTTPQQTVVVEESVIRIAPNDPQIVYVPQYDPQVIYVYDDDDDYYAGAFTGSVIGFGAGFALGAWLDLDCDWYRRDVVYCRPGYWGGYRHCGVVAWGDRWHSKVGVRRCFKGGYGRGYWTWNHGGAWQRGGSSPRPSYSGRFRSNDSRRQFVNSVRGGDRSAFRRRAGSGDRADFRQRFGDGGRTPVVNRTTPTMDRISRPARTGSVRRSAPATRRQLGESPSIGRSTRDFSRGGTAGVPRTLRSGSSRDSGFTLGRSSRQADGFRVAERGRPRPSYDNALRRSTGTIDLPRSSAGTSIRRGTSGGTLERQRSGGFPSVRRESSRAPSRSAFSGGGSSRATMRSATRAPSNHRSGMRSGSRGGPGRSSGMRSSGGRRGGGRR